MIYDYIADATKRNESLASYCEPGKLPTVVLFVTRILHVDPTLSVYMYHPIIFGHLGTTVSIRLSV